ncbi:hypothetical protein, partial [Massilia psychrophila]|uniref:hypothetical protein n=1 Tax=Massilia psychrophila TaxID=1603353 RepID=UPI001E4EA1F3
SGQARLRQPVQETFVHVVSGLSAYLPPTKSIQENYPQENFRHGAGKRIDLDQSPLGNIGIT